MYSKISEDTMGEISRLSPADLAKMGVVRPVPGKTDEFICPNCGNGEGKDATGIKPYHAPDHVGYKCHKCGKSFNNLELCARHYNLDTRGSNFIELVKRICADFALTYTKDESATEARSEKKKFESPPPESLASELDLIKADLAKGEDSLKRYLTMIGRWRGLTIDTLLKFGCRYDTLWTPPKNRATGKYAKPTSRIIIPSTTTPDCADYLARDMDSDDKFSKMHAGKKSLFNPRALTKGIVFVVEGAIDAISIEQVKFHAVATGGADSYRLVIEEYKKLSEKDKPVVVIILYDNDETGRNFAPKLKQELEAAGCSCNRYVAIRYFPKGQDANDILTSAGEEVLKEKLHAFVKETLLESENNSKPPDSQVPSENQSAETSFDYSLYEGDYSDLDNGQRIAKFGKDKICWLTDDERWLTYDKGIWTPRSEKNSVITPLVTELFTHLLHNARNKDDKGVAYIYAKHKTVNAALPFVKGCKEILIESSDLNKHKNLINVQNGVIDLQTGAFYPHTPDYLMTKQAAVTFEKEVDGEAKALVNKFLADILPDFKTRLAVLRYIAYALTGEKPYHISLFWRGGGANGKSTLIDFVMKLFGTYAVKLPATALLESNRPLDANCATPALAQLDGDIRLAIADELPRNARLAAALFKTITGDETTYARALYHNPKKIELRAKLILNGNHLPAFDTDDGGLMRRINNVEFTETFKGDRADPDLPNKLSQPQARSALLKILVDEAKIYYREGLIESEAMQEAKAAYIAESDFVQEFIEEHCIVGEGGEITRKCFEEKLRECYPRESSRLKKKELLDQIVAKLEKIGGHYMKAHANRNVFRNVQLIDNES